jgi:hypothetical protein
VRLTDNGCHVRPTLIRKRGKFMESLRVFLESHKTSELPSQGKILEVMDSMEPLDAFRVRCVSCHV